MENKELRERMLSGKMYNDLSVELVQRREQAVFLTNDYNSTYGKPKEVREALLRKLLRCIGSSVHFDRISGVSLDSISVLAIISSPILIASCWTEISLR